jgi:hypothetical protein
MLLVERMLEIEFSKEEGLVAKIFQITNKFKVSLFQLKIAQKNLGAIEFEGNGHNPRNEVLNAWLYLEHNRNLALVERQRQRST